MPTEGFAGGDARCMELARWLPRLDAPHDLLFGVDLDPRRPDVPVSGAYVRHLADLSIAREFYSITGSAAEFDGVRRASERLPEGRDATLAGDYFGRKNSPLRLEAIVRSDVLRTLADDARTLRNGLGRMGVPFVDDETIALCQGLFRLGTLASFQFDVYPDGSLAGLLSATLFFRDHAETVVSPDETRRTVQRAMDYVEDLGISDDRCRMFGDGSFALGFPGIDDEGLPLDAAMPKADKLAYLDLYQESEEQKLDAFMRLPEMREQVTAEEVERFRGLIRQKCAWHREHLDENAIWEWQGGANLLVTSTKPCISRRGYTPLIKRATPLA